MPIPPIPYRIPSPPKALKPKANMLTGSTSGTTLTRLPKRPEATISIFNATGKALDESYLSPILKEANALGGPNETLILGKEGDKISISLFTQGGKHPIARKVINMRQEQNLEDAMAALEGRQTRLISVEEGLIGLIKTSKDIFTQLLGISKRNEGDFPPI